MSTIDAGPTTPPPQPPNLGSVLSRNIEVLARRKRAEEARAKPADKVAEAITRFTGSMVFVYLHVLMFGGWALCNAGWVPGAPKFDPTFVILATVASVEGIFLSTFVLISQNRAAVAADRRADLDLQINLLAEHEITRLVELTAAIAQKLDIPLGDDPELSELERDVAPESVLDSLDLAERERTPGRRRENRSIS